MRAVQEPRSIDRSNTSEIEENELDFLIVIIIGFGTVVGIIFLLRPWHLRWGATDDEIKRSMPGDEILENPTYKTTRAITIDAPVSDVWPWLVQMGYRRGGMYTYDTIDRIMGILDEPSADRILPEFQQLEVGDVIPMGSGPDWPVKSIEHESSLVVFIDMPSMKFSWCWELQGINRTQTRLILRIRTLIAKVNPLMIPFFHLIDFGSFLMTRRHLLGIKERVEANPLMFAS